MRIESETNFLSSRLAIWVAMACALAASAVALMLAWENIQLESELETLRRNNMSGTWTDRSRVFGGEQSSPAPTGRTGAAADTALASGEVRGAIVDASRSAGEARHDRVPSAEPAQFSGNGATAMSILDAIRASEEASKQYRSSAAAASPFDWKK